MAPHAWKQGCKSHAMPHATTDTETRATCLDASGVSDAGTASLGRSDPELSLTHVNCRGLQIYSHHSCSQILHWLTINEQIKYNIYLHVVRSSNSVQSCGVLWFLVDPEKLVMRYTIINWLHNVQEFLKSIVLFF